MNATNSERARINSEVRQLSSLPGYPFEEEGRVALVRAFIQAFPTVESICTAVASVLRTEGAECPTPPGVYTLARNLGYRQDAEERIRKIANQVKCRSCRNTGWLPVPRRRRLYPPIGTNVAGELVYAWETYYPVVRCDCAVGQAMRGTAA